METSQPHFEGMSKREVLEMQKPSLLIEYRESLLDKYSDIESEINLVNEVLDWYGIDTSDEYDYVPDNAIHVDFQEG